MTRPLVSLDNVDVALDGRTILHCISWRLMPGEHWAILGGNGSGKSTFLRLVRGELWPVPGCGKRVYAFDGAEQRTAVGVKRAVALVSPELQLRYLRQEWRLTGRRVVESGFGGGDYVYERLSANQAEAAARVARLMGADHLLGRNVQELSTGELRRLLIARALAGAPKMLACDEICDGLDAAARAGLLCALERVARQGTQLLFTTHRDGELVSAITHRLVLEKGRIAECGKVNSPRRLGDIPTPPLNRNRNPNPNPSLPKSSDTAIEIKIKIQSRSKSRSETSPRLLIRVRNADVFLGPRRVLRNVNWEMRVGEHWAVLGPNGAGKSTFLKLVLGDLPSAFGGRVKRFEFTARDTLWEAKRHIGTVSPDLQASYQSDATGSDVIGSGFHSSIGRTRKLNARQRWRVTEIAHQLGIEALLIVSASRVSYGEFRKLLLARALVHEPELLICDEPFDGLDAGSRRSMAAALQRVAANGTSLLVVTHHTEDLPACTTHVALLEAGRIAYQGPARGAPQFP